VNTQLRNVLSLNAGATDEYINVGDDENTAYRFMANADAQSVSVWFKAATNATQCIFSINDDTGGHQNYIIYTTAGTLKVVHIASGEENSIDYSMTYLDQWHHVIWAIGSGNSGGAELFVDGVSRGTTSVTMSSRPTDVYQDLAHIGRYTVSSDSGTWSDLTGYGTAGQLFSGLVSNVSIWDTKLNVANALAIYNSGSPLSDLTIANGNYNTHGDLQGWWKLDGNYNDSSGKGDPLL